LVSERRMQFRTPGPPRLNSPRDNSAKPDARRARSNPTLNLYISLTANPK
jgi:hypothetical protein